MMVFHVTVRLQQTTLQDMYMSQNLSVEDRKFF